MIYSVVIGNRVTELLDIAAILQISGTKTGPSNANGSSTATGSALKSAGGGN